MKLRLSYLANLPHIHFLSFIRFLPLCCLSAGIIAPATLFAAPNPTEIRMQQDIQQRQREEQLRQTMQPETDVRLQGERVNETLNQPMDNDDKQPCFAINEVVLEGEHHAWFQFALKQALHETDFQAGKCLNAGEINRIMTVAQNAVIGKRTYNAHHGSTAGLNSGKLVLTVLVGYLKNIEVDMSQADATHRLSLGIDDSGMKATGKYQGNITFSADNPLGLSDLFYVNYGHSIGNVLSKNKQYRQPEKRQYL
ncbi:ShlB/FhaC/HecB family hemolysin secretion/activation protein [Kingella negevensis]|uniref:ShlB/FhaC/HecB family hemolysin secretion/activation protein n=1 Tax=Kingella negevensis TaxID=1522312 RepID=UPI002550C6AC|nr:ShlB/FhaC/HecB family hemolysin secretion/activation protein [Kingella negevensis]MDK4700159.1 ShlB/FhaC/HecB family hemolysin secretion/activation protein [Kingella negevensis]